MESEEQSDEEFGGAVLHDEEPETYEHVSILEFNRLAEDYDKTPGERVIVSGVRRNQHIRDEELKDFVKIADAVAIIELHSEITEDEVNDWCNSPAGKLALAHWFEHLDPEEVVMT